MRISCADEHLSREKSRFYLGSRASRGNYRDQDMAANAKGHGSTRNNEKTMTFPQLHPRYIACDVMRSPHHASRSNVILRDERRTIGELSKSRSSKRREVSSAIPRTVRTLEKRRHENTASGCPRFPQFRDPSLALAPLVRSRAAERESR